MKYATIRINKNDIQASELDSFINKIEHGQKKHIHLLLDFEDVEYVNSGRLGVLIRKHKDLNLEGGGLAFVNVCESLASIFYNSGMSRIIGIFNSVADYEKTLQRNDKK
ncbi:MAG: hypothetical protein A2293_03280 [Elusimicrobia bacterium RIFOXYB2_FULL_49_7]|nr:MAG: hypothetical protein A2293_03280 [Elusimicrobia bacterium RIFOXYB2_FULL_49_7]